MDQTPAPLFRKQRTAIPSSALPSSSPAFGTPAHPPKPFNVNAPKAAILPIILPPATLRPLAFRTFTKKHSLTLTSTALQELASFIGRHCGSGWREEGLAERVLEEIARSWKNRNGGVIIEGTSKELQDILKTLEGNMSGGKLSGPKMGLPRGDSMLQPVEDDVTNTRLGLRPSGPPREDSNASFGVSGLGVQDEAEDDEGTTTDPRAWLKVINAFEQPRLCYNVDKKHFERFVPSGLCSLQASILTVHEEKPQNRHCSHQPHTRPQSSAIDTTSSTSASSATSRSRCHLSQRLGKTPYRGPFPAKALSK
jgi:DNA polymerase epsilon subunit 2